MNPWIIAYIVLGVGIMFTWTTSFPTVQAKQLYIAFSCIILVLVVTKLWELINA